MELREMILDEDAIEAGVEAISLVESPAIESDFVALSKQKEVKLATVSEEKRIVMGPILIPDKKIYRKQGEQEYEIFFSKDTVLKVSQLYQRKGLQSKSTLEHAISLEGITLVETWVKEDMEKDKSALYGLSDPVGTWMGSMKIYNDEVWKEYVQTGKVKGFSIEGFFKERVEASQVHNLKELYSKGNEDFVNELLLESETVYFSDYPKEASKVVKSVKKKMDTTSVLARQVLTENLCNGKPISLGTIKNMNAYLSAAATLPEKPKEFHLYGGEAALKWSTDKLKMYEEKRKGNAIQN